LEQLKLGDSKMVLVEMPFCRWTDRMVRAICDLPLMTGLIPVLAHVNRYRCKEQLLPHQDHLLKSGVLFQYNAGAFLSWKERRWALTQLDADCVHFLGSDAHNLTKRAPRLREAAQVIIKKRGAAAMDEITAFSTHMLENT
jgi:protein-tyrosine phosphatase